MERKDLIELIVECATSFAKQVKAQSEMGYHDLGVHAEQATIPILNAVFDLDLANANGVKKNHPAVDLIDSQRGVAFQITSTSAQNKVAETLRKFVANKLYEQYPTLFIYILTEKKENYNTPGIRGIMGDKLRFDANIHIIDYRDVLKRINFITSVDILHDIARHYKQLISRMVFLSGSAQGEVGFWTRKPITYAERINSELALVIGEENIPKVPELSELLSTITSLEKSLQEKEKELSGFKNASERHRSDDSLQDLLVNTCMKLEAEYSKIKREIGFHKEAVRSLYMNIQRQKQYFDQIDYQKTSERIREAGQLFEAGEYARVNSLLNYDGREDYVKQKLEEKERQSGELQSLADEEVLLALSKMQRHDWASLIPEIKGHFEKSIRLGKYGINTLQYSFFLDNIDQKEEGIRVLYDALGNLPHKEREKRASIWKGLGRLLTDVDNGKAIDAFLQAIEIYEVLFEEDQNSFILELAGSLQECSSLNIKGGSLEKANQQLWRAMTIVSNRNEEASLEMQKLTFIILIALGSVNNQLGNGENTISFLKLALQIGTFISIDNQEDEMVAMLGAVEKVRSFLGEKKDGANSETIYRCALYHYLRLLQWTESREDAFRRNKLLLSLGIKLLVDQEAIGAGVCFKGALKTFKTLHREGYSCLPEIAESLYWVGFFYMTQNKMKLFKRALSEALYLWDRRMVSDPVERLFQSASLLSLLYTNSFIGVSSSRYYKAYPFFDKALAIHRRLDEEFGQVKVGKWLELLRNRGVLLKNGLDKSSPIAWYLELDHLVSRAPSSSIEEYEGDILLALHEAGEVLIEQTDAANPLFLQISEDVSMARRALFRSDPEKYKDYLLSTLLCTGNKLAEIKQWKEACSYLQEGLNILHPLMARDPEGYNKLFVMPAFYLAAGYSALGDHEQSADVYLQLCDYFEDRISEEPRYAGLLSSLMLCLTEELLEIGQKDKAMEYIERSRIYVPIIDDRMEQERLSTSFGKLSATILVLLLIMIVSGCGRSHKQERTPVRSDSAETAHFRPSLSVRDMRSDLGVLWNCIREIHPAYGLYTPKDSLGLVYKRTMDSLTKDLSETEYISAIYPFISALKCGHTQVKHSENFKASAADRMPHLPFEVLVRGDKAWVTTHQVASLHTGDEILSIDQEPVSDIIRHGGDLYAMDGNNKTFKELFLSEFDGFEDACNKYYGWKPPYSIRIRGSDGAIKTISVDTVSASAPQSEPVREVDSYKDWTISPNTQYLPLRYFNGTATASFEVHSYQYADTLIFEKAFHEIRANGVKNLIIDLRHNTGGDIRIAAKLLTYLADKPFQMVGKVWAATPDPAKSKYAEYFDTAITESFYQSFMPLGGGVHGRYDYGFRTAFGNLLGKTGLDKINHFNGRLFVLIDGATFSSGAHTAAAIRQYCKKAIFIGRETAGGAEGCSGGTLQHLTLPHTGVVVEFPWLRLESVLKGALYGRGVLPDHVVEYTPMDIVTKRDADLETAAGLIH